MKVGFIGLGRMGEAIAARVLGGGHDLTVYNRTLVKSARLGKAGAASPQDSSPWTHSSSRTT